jgi:hypothetical protein
MAILHEAKEMTEQEIFNHVAEHLLTQRVQSAVIEEEKGEEPICLYRAGDLACAVGCLIPDSLYFRGMEGNGISNLIASYSFFKYLQPHKNLLAELQRLHDVRPPHSWSEALKEIAEKYMLDPPKQT